MRNSFLPFFFAVAAFFTLSCGYSCTPQNTTEPIEDDTKPSLKPGNYLFVASPFKDKWETGDQIYVHGSFGPKAQTITLKDSEISADGKTASVYLDEVTEYYAAPDGLYAVYPAAAAKRDNDNLMDYTTEIADFLTPVAAAYLQGDTFTFADASAILTFKVSGDYDTIAIGGVNRPAINPKTFIIEYSTRETNIYPATNDGYPFRYAPIENGAVTMVFPGGVNFKGDYSIYIGKNDNWTAIYTVTGQPKLKSGTKTDLGDITGKLVAYNGPKPKMPVIGKYTVYDVKLNELSGLVMSADGTFLWGCGDGGELAKIAFDGTIIDKWSIGGDTEGLTMDPETKDIYVAQEPCAVGRVKAPDYKKMETVLKIEEGRKYSNSGMEGITWYKDGKLYCGTQTGANLFTIAKDATSYKTDYGTYNVIDGMKSLNALHSTIGEVGGLCYDPLTDWLWVSDSNYRKIYALTGDGETLLCTYSVQVVENAESIYVDHEHSCIWVGCDTDTNPSRLYKYQFTGLDDAIITD
ncbi:MAG: hypothetical protein K6E61_00680 [Bacteroidales bacterium]|nr:hypothetical protein [Bacteroidales bacterium]